MAEVTDILDPSALNVLLTRDPLDLTDQDLDNIIRHFRAERLKWIEAEAAGKHTRAKATSGPVDPSTIVKIGVEDLEL